MVDRREILMLHWKENIQIYKEQKKKAAKNRFKKEKKKKGGKNKKNQQADILKDFLVTKYVEATGIIMNCQRWLSILVKSIKRTDRKTYV